MTDLSKLSAAVADLSARVDALLAKPAVPAPVDEQPAVDALAVQVETIVAKIPA
ncbi:MAG: hypothetical protein JWP25_4697 [Bradyrhizobium sp.]|nr:hypothetical protein [Bradyrhizobium sp.]